MGQTALLKINFPAGIISPGTLLQLLGLAAQFGVKQLRFGSRQQLLVDIPKKQVRQFAAQCAGKNITVSTPDYPAENIISSYAAAGIFITDGWLTQGVYKDVFDSLHHLPELKININDAGQTFVPLFTGHLNWIASPHSHFWYLYVRFPKKNDLFRWPELIYTNHLGAVSERLEKLILDEKIAEGTTLFQALKKSLNYISKNTAGELHLPKFHLPYYEGFNAAGENFWLGLYRRDETFSTDFLRDLCTICLQTKIGELYVTPWKTLIIKGIEKQHRPLWDSVLGKHRINVRHAANELAWLVEDDCADGLVLKRHIIRYFDKEDVRTYGLCFSVKIKSGSGVFGSVVIRREAVKNPGRLKTLERFTLLYTDNFNPNSGELLVFRTGVKKEFLGPYLVSLCKQFYEAAGTGGTIMGQQSTSGVAALAAPLQKILYQCRHCLTVYDECLGDPDQQVAAGVAFDQLPDNYYCPLCEADKQDFRLVNIAGEAALALPD